jgi:hypothetical protein
MQHTAGILYVDGMAGTIIDGNQMDIRRTDGMLVVAPFSMKAPNSSFWRKYFSR